MPTYEYKCPQCQTEFDVVMKMSEYGTVAIECTKCEAVAERFYRTAPNFKIPANMAYNGQVKVSGGNGKAGPSRVPINIWDEKPGGGYKVTRIGSKADINND